MDMDNITSLVLIDGRADRADTPYRGAEGVVVARADAACIDGAVASVVENIDGDVIVCGDGGVFVRDERDEARCTVCKRPLA